MSKSGRWLTLILSVWSCLPVAAQDFSYPQNAYPPGDEQIPGPPNNSAAELCCAKGGQRAVPEESFKAWLAYLQSWRREHLIRMGYDDAQYDRPELKWTQSSFIQPQMMAHDRYFYDPQTARYTVDRYLADLNKRYGGIDSVLIWPTYPNLGIDDRNQFDLIRDMPGGIEGLRAAIEVFHHNGVRVLFPYNPWDRGTRPEPASDWVTLARLMADIGADGVNADTMEAVPPAARAASDLTGHPLAFEPENGANGDADFAIAWNNLTWGYWKYPFEPMISKNKWLEPRHMVHVCERWARDKTDSLQAAFFNGLGYESWENIFGVWNSLEDRDAEALRRIGAIDRTFAQLLASPGWEPHTPMLQYGVFASKFPGEGRTLWTVVNRNEYDVKGRQMEVPYPTKGRLNGRLYYDVWHGVKPGIEVSQDKATLSFDIEGHGYAAILGVDVPALDQEVLSLPGHPPLPGDDVAKLLAEMNELAKTPLSSLSREWHALPQRMVEIAPTKPSQTQPEGMVRIPQGDFTFEVSGIEVEGGNQAGVDVQMPWEDSPRRNHQRLMHLRTFYIDRYPVTNAQFKAFLEASKYHPSDDHNFLRRWQGGSYPEGWAAKPVTWVSLEDARAYAAWAGKRLPHEWEWQYAAQGSDGRLYPWGNTWDPSAVPPAEEKRTLSAPADVGANSKGASPFGVMDLVGNVWQWTDEYQDDHTRAAIVRGGSYYRPQGSIWYFPQAYKLNEHGKYLLMAPSLDRSGAIGFRCVVDAQ